MKKISKFDLAMIIAFVVIGLIGFGAWWYLSGNLVDAQTDVAIAKKDYDSLAVNQNIVVSATSQENLQANIDLIKAQLDPLIQNKLEPTDNKLNSIDNKDPVAWKHDLDDEVARLTAAAKLRGVKIPQNFYFSFSRYLNQSPSDQQTAVLSKQLLAVDQLANILINAPVKSIVAIRRTYEEDGGGGGGPAALSTGTGTGRGTNDQLGGSSIQAGGGIYTAYPFEIDFDTNPEVLRKVIDDLVKCPYIFVLRTMAIQNSQSKSPLTADLDRIAAPPPSVTDSQPGEVAATTTAQPPQFLFGDGTLHVRALVDLIEWNGVATDTAPPANNGAPRGRNSAPGAN
jgi:hypothetical protein